MIQSESRCFKLLRYKYEKKKKVKQEEELLNQYGCTHVDCLLKHPHRFVRTSCLNTSSTRQDLRLLLSEFRRTRKVTILPYINVLGDFVPSTFSFNES